MIDTVSWLLNDKFSLKTYVNVPTLWNMPKNFLLNKFFVGILKAAA